MKISYNWLNDYIDLEGFSIERIAEIMTDLGLEVAGVEEVESVKGGLEGIVVGEVVTCEKHPNADKLSVTTVDIGTGENLHIVCGAPNVAVGQKVPVATIGSKLYSAEGEEWLIKKGKIRGEVSEGMICAEDELGLGSSHDGIMVLSPDVVKGTLAKTYFKIEKDFVYDIDLTPNRSDATSHLGVALDLAAYLKVNEHHSGEVKFPDVRDFKQDKKGLSIDVFVEDTEACPRYSGLTISDIQIKESPDWLRNRLTAIGVRPINNIVDITNYILHEYGQPLHAFDADKIAGETVRVKKLGRDSIFQSLDEVDRKLTEEDLMICNGNSEGMCIAGVFGGLHSGVTDSTKNIFLESAHFEAKTIRKTSMHHILRTDAAMVFEKGSDPNITVTALKKAAIMIKEMANGSISSPIIDIYPETIEPKIIKVRFDHVNRLIGIKLAKDKLKEIFAALRMDIVQESDDALTITIPTGKADVTREVDVIEEILRIYGLNNVPIPSKVAISVSSGDRKESYKMRNYMSEYLSGQSFHEAMSLSLTMSKRYEETHVLDRKNFVFINNTSNTHLDILRPEMIFSALENISYNQNRQQRNIKMYEFGKAYQRSNDRLSETEYLSLYGCGNLMAKSWKTAEVYKIDYFSLKAHVENILSKMNVTSFAQHAMEDDRFEFGTVWKKGDVELVRIGKVQGHLLKAFGVKQPVFYAEINFDNVLKMSDDQFSVTELSKYPSVSRDLAIVISKKHKFEEIYKLAFKSIKKILKSVELFDVYDNEEQLGEGMVSYAVSLRFEDRTKTLRDKEIDKMMRKFIGNLEQKLQVKIRK